MRPTATAYETDLGNLRNRAIAANVAYERVREELEDSRREAFELRRELAELKEKLFRITSWNPIETAPKDGTFILVWNSKGINEVFWDEESESWQHDVDFDNTFPLRGDHPTLWKELPFMPGSREL